LEVPGGIHGVRLITSLNGTALEIEMMTVLYFDGDGIMLG